MPTTFDTRRTNLRRLMEQWGGPTSLAAKLGHSNGSYMAQLAGPHPTRDVSEKVARQIELTLGLPPNWMDTKHKTGPTEPDTSVLIDVVAAVQDVLHAEGVKMKKEKFTELVNLAYERATETGTIDNHYVQRLVRLLR
jgi:hypothetical protein